MESAEELQLEYEVIQPDCLNENGGVLSVSSISGGVSPFQYSLNQVNFQDDPLFEGLGPGTYQIGVIDANGCTTTSTASLDAIPQLTVELGPDESIEYGDSLTIEPFFSVASSQLASVVWEGVDCQGCLNVLVAPAESTTYTITVIDDLGCSASDELQVLVEKNFNVYIPNAFSPDFDGINDHFTIFGNQQLVRILQLQIFDRWGEAVFTGFNLPPNDLSYGWDGMYRDEMMNPGVFVFFAELEFRDGSTQLIEGEVNLIR